MSVAPRPIDVAATAAEAAEVAARSNGLTVDEISDLPSLAAAANLLDGIWSNSSEEPLISVSTLKALAHSGSYVAAAFRGEELAGALVGFLGLEGDELRLHSHVLGVSPAVQDRSIGFALKQHQRAWALARGITTIAWTFDPLVRRNAYFNLTKLGATITAYYEDFYGTMRDGINAGDESDRVLVEWMLDTPAVIELSRNHGLEPDVEVLRKEGAAVALETGPDGGPLLDDGATATTLLVQVPGDIVVLRAEDPASARRWRRAVRDTLGRALHDGYVARGMTRSGWYVLRNEGA